jgi:hypothetical protein
MHILYVDESGTPELDPDSSHFVLVGLTIPLGSWRKHDGDLRGVVASRRLAGVELHAGWMARRYPEQERINGFVNLTDEQRRDAVTVERRKDLAKASLRGDKAVQGLRKNYTKTAAYTHLSHAERISLLQAVADRLKTWTDARLFGEAQSKTHLSIQQRALSRETALEQLTTRFSTYLRQVRGSDMGIIVHDQQQASSTKLTAVFRRWHETGTAFTRITNIAETPLFVDSSLTVMVQLADLAAYATRRFFEHNETDLFNRIYKRFDRTPQSGELVGLRHYTGSTPCSCRVCKDHGRHP